MVLRICYTVSIMPPKHPEHERLLELTKENERLLIENNTLLKSINKKLLWGLRAKIVWYGLLIGLPFALYYYILEPYFTTLGSSFDTFSEGMREIPGWKQLNNAVQGDPSVGE